MSAYSVTIEYTVRNGSNIALAKEIKVGEFTYLQMHVSDDAASDNFNVYSSPYSEEDEHNDAVFRVIKDDAGANVEIASKAGTDSVGLFALNGSRFIKLVPTEAGDDELVIHVTLTK